jgi:serine/threonine protein phosphatase PrpC
MVVQAHPSTLNRLRCQAAAETGPGARRSDNQDAVWLSTLMCPDSSPVDVFVVADGMGGYEGGQLAAQLVSACFGHALLDASEEAWIPRIRRAVEVAHAELHARRAESSELAKMGSTLAAALFDGARLWVAHLGDTRIYQLRAGQLTQLTADHSWVAQQVRDGVISAADAEAHPMRNLLMRGFLPGPAAPEVDLREIDWQPGDRLLMCTDGVWGVLSPERLTDLTAQGTPRASASAIVQAARDSTDNVTALVIDLPAAPQQPPAGALLPWLNLRRVGRKGWAVVGLVSASLIAAGVVFSSVATPAAQPLRASVVMTGSATPGARPTIAPSATRMPVATSTLAGPALPTDVRPTQTLQPATPATPLATATLAPAATLPQLAGDIRACLPLDLNPGSNACGKTRSEFDRVRTIHFSWNWRVPPTPSQRVYVRWQGGTRAIKDDICVVGENGGCDTSSPGMTLESAQLNPFNDQSRILRGSYTVILLLDDEIKLGQLKFTVK